MNEDRTDQQTIDIDLIYHDNIQYEKRHCNNIPKIGNKNKIENKIPNCRRKFGKSIVNLTITEVMKEAALNQKAFANAVASVRGKKKLRRSRQNSFTNNQALSYRELHTNRGDSNNNTYTNNTNINGCNNTSVVEENIKNNKKLYRRNSSRLNNEIKVLNKTKMEKISKYLKKIGINKDNNTTNIDNNECDKENIDNNKNTYNYLINNENKIGVLNEYKYCNEFEIKCKEQEPLKIKVNLKESNIINGNINNNMNAGDIYNKNILDNIYNTYDMNKTCKNMEISQYLKRNDKNVDNIKNIKLKCISRENDETRKDISSLNNIVNPNKVSNNPTNVSSNVDNNQLMKMDISFNAENEIPKIPKPSISIYNIINNNNSDNINNEINYNNKNECNNNKIINNNKKNESIDIKKASIIKKYQLQFANEYQEDIFNYLYTLENCIKISPKFILNQIDINEKMRAILVDWLVEVHLKFTLLPETLFIAINILDRYLDKVQVARNQLQLVGITALLIASKYEEIYPPEIKSFVYVTDNAYTKEDVLIMEENILNTLEYDLTYPTSLRYLQVLFTKLELFNFTGSDFDKSHFYLCEYILELTLIKTNYSEYSELEKAFSALFLICGKNIKEKEKLILICKEIYGESWEKSDKNERINKCTEEMRDFARDNYDGKYEMKAIFNKFNTLKFLNASNKKCW